MSAYLYYKQGVNVIDDFENDILCNNLADNWGEVPLRYKPLLDPDNTGGEAIRHSTFRCRYTQLVESGAIAWYAEHTGERLVPRNDDHYFGAKLERDMQIWEMM